MEVAVVLVEWLQLLRWVRNNFYEILGVCADVYLRVRVWWLSINVSRRPTMSNLPELLCQLADTEIVRRSK